MEIKFWAHEFELLFFYPFFLAISFAIFLAGLILMFTDLSFYPLMLMGLVFLIILICSLFFDKRPLSKVVITENYIALERMKKEISKISWSEVTDVDSVPVGKGRFYLSFISNKQEISVDITKKMYKALVQLCPNFNIIMKINQMNEFKWLHKEDNKK